jgi:predicted metal-dependent RNase
MEKETEKRREIRRTVGWSSEIKRTTKIKSDIERM